MANIIEKTKDTGKIGVAGDCNDLARKRSEHKESYTSKKFAEGFEHIRRAGIQAGKLIKNKDGVKTFVYGG